jgi:hypothetical protein
MHDIHNIETDGLLPPELLITKPMRTQMPP